MGPHFAAASTCLALALNFLLLLVVLAASGNAEDGLLQWKRVPPPKMPEAAARFKRDAKRYIYSIIG